MKPIFVVMKELQIDNNLPAGMAFLTEEAALDKAAVLGFQTRSYHWVAEVNLEEENEA
jgi:hypothetical protein